MRVSDFIFKFLTDRGVDTVFMVSGGQAMFLVDAVCQNKKLKTICTHHEQTAGMAADGFGRITGKISVALVTAGPGAVNVMNGLVGGWTDSSPMMVISGQSALSCVQYQDKHPIRQIGIQGINIKPLVEKVTKFFITIDDPAKVLFYMQKAYFLALNGRPGPVWIDVPLDVQRMDVPENLLEEFRPDAENINLKSLKDQVGSVIELISHAKRPIFLVGQGIRLANAVPIFQKVLGKINIPVLTSRLGIDLIDSENELYVGRPGNYGDRPANFAIQNSDLIIVIRCRLASALIGHTPKNFGKHAKKIAVDIDIEELKKPGVDIDLKINADAKRFLEQFFAQINCIEFNQFDEWIKQ